MHSRVASTSPQRGKNNLQGAVATNSQVSKGWMWSCYTSARAGELSSSAPPMKGRRWFGSSALPLLLLQPFQKPLLLASPFYLCLLHPQPASVGLCTSIAAVQHSSAPRPLFGCVGEHPHSDRPSRLSPPPTDLAASLRPVQAKRASPVLASHPFTIHSQPIPSTPGSAFLDE